MSMPRPLAPALVALAINVTPLAAADSPRLGAPISEVGVGAWNITVFPDGTGLPPGSGTATAGAMVYADKGCAACHGENAAGGANGGLVGNPPLDRIEARKTIANFWANATTLFDIIRRWMPWPSPRTLSNDEVYALTAYILALNKIIGEGDVMNAQTLPKVKMPNRDNFIIRFPDRI
jgi:S-disulfanyl-L-cysteine oxidoreductase SoxD